MFYYRYSIIRIIIFILFFILNEFIPINWIALIIGALIPLLHLILFRDKYLFEFPWELYLLYAYIFYSVFFSFEPEFIYFGIGFSLSRLILYFQLNKSN